MDQDDEDSSDDDEPDDYAEALAPAADCAMAQTEAHRRLPKARRSLTRTSSGVPTLISKLGFEVLEVRTSEC